MKKIRKKISNREIFWSPSIKNTGKPEANPMMHRQKET